MLQEKEEYGNSEILEENMVEDLDQKCENKLKKKNTMEIPQTALAAIRYNVTNRQTSAITSGFLKDLMSAGVVPPGNEHLVLDPKKIHRAGENIMKELREEQETHMEENDLTCLMVDARIDNTKKEDTMRKQKNYTTQLKKRNTTHSLMRRENILHTSQRSKYQRIAL